MSREHDKPFDCIDLQAQRLLRTDDMVHAEIRQLHDYWERLRAGDGVPYRSDVDPRDMECNARNLFVVEETGDRVYRFRLAGSALLEAFGMELRGMPPRAVMEGRSRESLSALIGEVLDEPGVGYLRLSPVGGSCSDGLWEMLLLPLRTDLGRIERILGGLHPVSGSPRAANRPLRFAIESASVRPIADAAAPEAAAGFAEGAAPFAGRRPDGPDLTAIEGGGDTGDALRTPRERPDLRIVGDD
jgi:hypothetical protein